MNASRSRPRPAIDSVPPSREEKALGAGFTPEPHAAAINTPQARIAAVVNTQMNPE